MIGAVLRGMDLVALGNYSGSAAKPGSDATMAIMARKDSGISKAMTSRALKGKKHCRLLRDDQPSLHPGADRGGRTQAGTTSSWSTRRHRI